MTSTSGPAALRTRSGSSRIAGVARLACEGVLLPPGVGVDVDDVAVLGEAVDESDDAGGAGEHGGAPLFEREVRGDDRRALLVATIDEGVEQVGGLAVARQVADLVEDQDVGRGVATEPAFRVRAPTPGAASR